MDSELLKFGYSWFMYGFALGALLSAFPFMISYAIKAMMKIFKM